jgi:hypothetical protein
MRSLRFAPLQAGFAFALGLVLGSGFLSGFAPLAEARTPAMMVTSTAAGCASYDAVSDFVCRNRWMGQHQYSYR